MHDKHSKTSDPAVGSTRLVRMSDTQLLDALQELPCALDLTYHRGQPKSDSVPSRPDQISHFLATVDDSKCLRCGAVIGNQVFTVCDACWDTEHSNDKAHA